MFISERAFQAFKHEITDQLSTASKFLREGQLEISKEAMLELKVIFHRIKGGAGFLGFREIELCAAELQQLVEDSLAGAAQKLNLATDILGEIELLAKALPETSLPPQGK